MVHMLQGIGDGDGEIEDLSRAGVATPTVLHFVAAILGQEEPATSPIDGVRQSEFMDALYESARLGRPVSPVRTGGDG